MSQFAQTPTAGGAGNVGVFVEETGEQFAMLPSGVFLQETQAAAPGGSAFIPLIGRGPGLALAGRGGLAA